MIARDAWEVYSKTFAACLVVYLANLAVDLRLQPRIHDWVFRWAAAFAIVQTVAISLLSLYLVALRAYSRLKESIHDQIRPAIRDRVLALAFEGESWSSAVPGHGPGRHVLEESIAHALTTLKGSGRERIARFAVEHGFEAQWVKAFSSRSKRVRKRAISLLGLISPVAGETVLPIALHDKHPAVRTEACRGLLIRGERPGIDKVFCSVLRESLLTRALLADDLKRHAPYLLRNTIPPLLEKPASLETARCFEILIAWKRALPSFDVAPWLSGEPNRFLWPLVLALLPYVSIDNSIEEHLISALESPDLEVQCAAAQAAGRLKRERLIPALSLALGQDKRLGLASANAIAQMGEPGERYLEKIVIGPDRNAAALAMEALERVTVKTQ